MEFIRSAKRKVDEKYLKKHPLTKVYGVKLRDNLGSLYSNKEKNTNDLVDEMVRHEILELGRGDYLYGEE